MGFHHYYVILKRPGVRSDGEAGIGGVSGIMDRAGAVIYDRAGSAIQARA
jgi:hypothetical protein